MHQHQPPPSEPLIPPKLHWAFVLVLGVITCGLFIVYWMFLQAVWVRKIDRKSNAVVYLIGYFILALIGAVLMDSSTKSTSLLGALLQLASYIFFYSGYYSMRRSMLGYYNIVERISLRLSNSMVFFFSLIYFQYHMTRIARWKMTGVLSAAE